MPLNKQAKTKIVSFFICYIYLVCGIIYAFFVSHTHTYIYVCVCVRACMRVCVGVCVCIMWLSISRLCDHRYISIYILKDTQYR